MSAAGSLQPKQFFHGTVRAGLRSIQPAEQHGKGVVFPHDTDTGHAYAASSEADAWNYAEKAWHASGTGIPRVYEVEPKGAYEPDPQTDAAGRMRGNLAGDVRSKAGFKVKRQLPMPEDMGEPKDWR